MKKRKACFIGGWPVAEALRGIFAGTDLLIESGDERFFCCQTKKGLYDIIFLDLDHASFCRKVTTVPERVARLAQKGYKVVTFSSHSDFDLIRAAHRAGAQDHIVKPFNHRELTARVFALLDGRKRICCVGGGSGLFSVLACLKPIPNTLLISLVNMSDDGGSSGRLRSSFGVLPPGDIRRSLVALSNAPEVMNEIIQHRFEKGGELKDHSVGNLILTALAEEKGSMAEAVRALGDVLNIQGIVLPISNTLNDLVAEFEDGTIIRGEHLISTGEGRDPSLRIKKVWHEPEAECSVGAYACLLHADMILIGPGDLFSSVITNLIIPRVKEALILGKGEKIYICNLMTRPGETTGLNAPDHVKKIQEAVGADFLDKVIVSNTRFTKTALAEYAKLGQFPVSAGTPGKWKKRTRAKVVFFNVADEEVLIRHDQSKLESELRKFIHRL